MMPERRKRRVGNVCLESLKHGSATMNEDMEGIAQTALVVTIGARNNTGEVGVRTSLVTVDGRLIPDSALMSKSYVNLFKHVDASEKYGEERQAWILAKLINQIAEILKTSDVLRTKLLGRVSLFQESETDLDGLYADIHLPDAKDMFGIDDDDDDD